MATIRERQPGVWQVRVFTGRNGEGEPTQVAVTVRGTKRDALREAAKLEDTPQRGAAGRTVADALQAWLEHNEASYSPATLRDHTGRVRKIADDKIAAVALARLTVADVDRWLTRLRRDGVGAAAVRNRLTVLRAALNQAVVWGWITSNQATLARAPQRKKVPRDVMSVDEVIAVIDAAGEIDPMAGLALRVAAIAGARRAEIAALRWADLDGRTLTVDSAVAITQRARDVEGSVGLPALADSITKTGERHRVSLDDETVRLWNELGVEREDYGPYVFALGELPANPDRVGWWWQRARKLAGIDPKWRLHDLRHFSATMAIAAGHDVRTVAQRLGHADAAMTLRVYAHAIESADEAVGAGLGQLLDARSGLRVGVDAKKAGEPRGRNQKPTPDSD